MKLRLTQEHYETFTGQMGVVFFEDGLSTTDVKPSDAVRMAAQFLCAWEDGTTASVAQSILDHSHATIGTIGVEMNADQAMAQQSRESIDAAAKLVDPRLSEVKVTFYTQKQLSEIADSQGIKGLRAIAEPLGIKSNSIKEMIDALVEVGAKG